MKIQNVLKFIPNLAEHTTSLRNLIKKDVVFKLQKPQLDAIENLKTLVTSARCLKVFDSFKNRCRFGRIRSSS